MEKSASALAITNQCQERNLQSEVGCSCVRKDVGSLWGQRAVNEHCTTFMSLDSGGHLVNLRRVLTKTAMCCWFRSISLRSGVKGTLEEVVGWKAGGTMKFFL